jgi:hypothetical protein
MLARAIESPLWAKPPLGLIGDSGDRGCDLPPAVPSLPPPGRWSSLGPRAASSHSLDHIAHPDMTLPRPPSYSALFPPTTALAAFFPPKADGDDLAPSSPTAQRPLPQRTVERNAFGLEGFCTFAGVVPGGSKTADWAWLDFARHGSDDDDDGVSETTTEDDDELASPTHVGGGALRHPALIVRLPSAPALDGCGQLDKLDGTEAIGSPMLETSFGFTDSLLEDESLPATPGGLSLKSVLSYFSLRASSPPRCTLSPPGGQL